MSGFEIVLLSPVVLLLCMIVASLFGYNSLGADRLNMLEAATSWGLLFLVLFGGVRGWRSIRLLLVAYIVWQFSSVIYDWLTYGMVTGYLLLRLFSVVLFGCVAVLFFWPRKSRRERKPRSGKNVSPGSRLASDAETNGIE